MNRKKKVMFNIPWFIKPVIKYPKQEVIANFNSTIIELGRVLKTSYSKTIGIPLNHVFEHIFVTGSTGSGKTFTVAKFISRLNEKAQDINIVLLDWHGEYSRLLKKYKYILPTKYSINLPLDEPLTLVDLLIDVLELSPSQAFILEKILKEYRDKISSIEELVDIIENYNDESVWMRESRLALLRKISPLRNYSRLFEDNIEKNFINTLLSWREQVFVIDLSLIQNMLVRKIYASLIIKSISNKIMNMDFNKKLVLVIEEAQNYVSREKPLRIISSLLAEVRKFGLGLVIVSQSPYKLLEDVMINTNTKIIHSIKSSIDLDIVTKVLYLPIEYQRIIPYLNVGEAIFYTRGLKKPLIIKIE